MVVGICGGVAIRTSNNPTFSFSDEVFHVRGEWGCGERKVGWRCGNINIKKKLLRSPLVMTYFMATFVQSGVTISSLSILSKVYDHVSTGTWWPYDPITWRPSYVALAVITI